MKIKGTMILKAENENCALLKRQEYSLWSCQVEQLLRSSQGSCAELSLYSGRDKSLILKSYHVKIQAANNALREKKKED